MVAPGELTILGLAGEVITFRTDHGVDAAGRERLARWLDAEGFAMLERNETRQVHRGSANGSFPIELTIEWNADDTEAKMSMAYQGSGFKRFFDRRLRRTGALSNQIVALCLDDRIMSRWTMPFADAE